MQLLIWQVVKKVMNNSGNLNNAKPKIHFHHFNTAHNPNLKTFKNKKE